jgi:hypothetical protein
MFEKILGACNVSAYPRGLRRPMLKVLELVAARHAQERRQVTGLAKIIAIDDRPDNEGAGSGPRFILKPVRQARR